MHTIIKIAVVSVLSLFAIVGVVSISKAEETVWYCEMTRLLSVADGKVTDYNLEKFKFIKKPKTVTFGSGGYFNNASLHINRTLSENVFYANGSYSNLVFSFGFLNYAFVESTQTVAITAKCDKF